MSPERDIYKPLFVGCIEYYLGLQTSVSILDVGCGDGELVAALNEAGWDAFGCDFVRNSGLPDADYSLFVTTRPKTRAIQPDPYRLPFEDGQFDVVLSSNTFEHVMDKIQTLREIHRVLKPGGYTMNAFPSKWYLPLEPHLHVPFVSWMDPNVPDWWLSLWARLGIRNTYQSGLGWRQTYADNQRFCREAINYASHRDYAQLVRQVFGNFEQPHDLYVKLHRGASTRFTRRLPRTLHPLLMTFREQFFVARKDPVPTGPAAGA